MPCVRLPCTRWSGRCPMHLNLLAIERRPAERAVGHECVVRNIPDALPSGSRVESFGVSAGDGIEDEHRFAFLSCLMLGCSHQALSDA